MKRFSGFVFVVLGLLVMRPAYGVEPTAVVQFRDAYATLARADAARDVGNIQGAIDLYRKALADYVRLSKRYPDWQPGVVRFRITYCDNQLDSLARRLGRAEPVETERVSRVSALDRHDFVADAGIRPAAIRERQMNLEVIRTTAESCIKNGEIEKARAMLLEGLHLDPDNQAIRLLMAITQCKAGRFEDAMFIAEQLVEDNPNNAPAHALLGAAMFGMGDADGARSHLDIATNLDPWMSDAHYNLAQVWIWISPPNRERARNHYRKSIELGGQRDFDLESLLSDNSE